MCLSLQFAKNGIVRSVHVHTFLIYYSKLSSFIFNYLYHEFNIKYKMWNLQEMFNVYNAHCDMVYIHRIDPKLFCIMLQEVSAWWCLIFFFYHLKCMPQKLLRYKTFWYDNTISYRIVQLAVSISNKVIPFMRFKPYICE